MNVTELIEQVRRDPMERLRWRVLKSFGVLPCSPLAQSMTDEDCLRYAAHMAADRYAEGDENPAFDVGRYLSMKGGTANDP